MGHYCPFSLLTATASTAEPHKLVLNYITLSIHLLHKDSPLPTQTLGSSKVLLFTSFKTHIAV